MNAEPVDGEVTRLDDLEPGSYDISGKRYPWWPDHKRRFAAWQADNPEPSGYAAVALAWADCQRRARRAWARRLRLAVVKSMACPACHGSGLKAEASADRAKR